MADSKNKNGNDAAEASATALGTVRIAVIALTFTTLALLASTIALAIELHKDNDETIIREIPSASAATESPAETAVVPTTATEEDYHDVATAATEVITETIFASMKPPEGDNFCDGAKVQLDDVACSTSAVDAPNHGPQAGANVTKGYQGTFNTTVQPLLVPFYEAGLCAVNVHWHVGAEHLSVGEYDETGKSYFAFWLFFFVFEKAIDYPERRHEFS